MTTGETAKPPTPIGSRVQGLFQEHRQSILVGTDRMFAILMVCQWVAGIIAAFVVSPRTWAGLESRTHIHVWAALGIGGLISFGPIILALVQPGRVLTRHVIAVGQMLTSALLIHLTGGRIETHFHVFGSLAFLAFYRDWRVLITATVVVAGDHLVRGLVWPESVYGIANASPWRFLEHAGWVIFEDVVLFRACWRGINEMRLIAERQAELEATNAVVEEKVSIRTAELKESEQRLQVQYAVASFLGAAQNMQAVYKDILPVIAGTLGWKFGALWTVERREDALSCLGLWSADDSCDSFAAATRTLRFDMGVGIPGRVWANPKPIWVEDVTRDPNFPRAAVAQKSGLHGGIAFPVLVGTEFLGVIEFYSDMIQAPGEELLHTISTIANQIGQYISRRRAEEHAKEQEDMARQAAKMESVGRLAAGIAHEINTPIQYVGDNIRFLEDAFGSFGKVIGGYASFRKGLNGSVNPELERRIDEVLRDSDADYLEKEVPKAITQSLEGVNRVAKIVQAMKEFSHPGAQEMTPTDLNKAIETTATVARSEWKYVADLQTELDPDLPLIPCLPGDLNQVILNLIVNAAHAIGDVVSGQEGAKGKITIRTRQDGDWAEIRIGDTGTGIPEHVRPKLFEPFFTTKGVGKGTGQGLALSRAIIVGKHQGSISYQTEIGKGTTFIVRLPLTVKP
jgi:signal transduction histidine kinase